MANDVKLDITGDPSGLAAALEEAKTKVVEASSEMRESLETINESFNKINETIVAFTAVLAGAGAFGEIIASTTNLNFQSMELGKQFGISATQASVLKEALNQTFLTQDQFSAAGARLTRTLSTNEVAVRDLGVETREASGGFRPLVDIMTDVNEKLLEMKEGADRNVEGTKVYGRGWSQVIDILRLTKESMAEADQGATELNLKVSQESLAATLKYKSAVVEMNETLEAVRNTIGLALLPALTDAANWFRSTGPAAIANTREAIRGIVTVFAVLRNELKDEVDFIVGEFVSLVTEIEGDAKAINKALHFDWAGVTAELKEKTDEQKAIYAQYQDDLVANKKQANDLIASLDANFSNQNTPTAAPGGGEGADPAKGKDDSRKLLDERLALLEKEFRADAEYVDKMREAQEQAYKAEEAAFSKAASQRIAIAEQEVALEAAAYGKGSPQYEAAQKHLVEVQQQAQEQLRQMADAFAKVEDERQQQSLAEDEKILQEKFQRHEISNAQLLAGEIALEDKRAALALKAAEEQKALIDPLHDPVAYAKILADIESLELQHDNRISQIRKEAAQRDRQVWDSLNKEIQSGFASNITKLVEGTETFSQAMRNLLKDVLNSIIQFLAQWVVQHAATMLANLVQTKVTALGQIQANAGVAGAAGVASFAGAPWPLDVGAPAFGAEAASAAASFSTLSAEGGYDIPRGINPRVQLHEEEMVLPSPISKGLRNLIAANDGGGRGSRGGAGDTNISVSAMDSKSVERALRGNNGPLHKAMRDLNRRKAR
jgi:hypothetical protein